MVVYPFHNEQGQADLDYLGPSLARALSDDLARTPGLSVVKARPADDPGAGPERPMALARGIGADLTVLGSYRIQGDRLHVEVRILRVLDGSSYAQFSLEHPVADLLFFSSELSNKVLEALEGIRRVQGAPTVMRSGTHDSEAYRLYLQGTSLLENRDPGSFRRALTCFRGAIERDPSFASAHCGLSECYGLMGVFLLLPVEDAGRLAEASAHRALELDPNLGEAHASLATIRFRYGWDPKGSEQEFRKALALDPDNARIHHGFGSMLVTMGRWDEALEHLHRALDLEPLSIPCRINFAIGLHWAGRSNEALEEMNKVLDQNPSATNTLLRYQAMQEELGQIEGALEKIDQLVRLGAVPEQASLALRNAFEAQGAKGYWAERVRQTERQTSPEPVHLAELVAQLGEKERTLRLQERAVREHSAYSIWIPKDPMFASLHGDPRFQAILRRLGFPEA